MRLALIAALLFATADSGAVTDRTPEQADAFARKLTTVLARGETAPSGHRTDFSNDELNAYLTLRLAPAFPAGVTEPAVTLVGEGRISGTAIVDLDGLRRKSSGGWLDPSAYLTGRLPVLAVGTLTTSNGSGRLVIERAEVSGVPVPISLLQELVTFYTRSPELPDGVDLNQPFPLPSRIQRIDVRPGLATVVQ